VTVPFTLLVNSDLGLGFANAIKEPTEDHRPGPLTLSNVALTGTDVLTHPCEGIFATNPKQVFEHVSLVSVTVKFTGVLHTESGVKVMLNVVPTCGGTHENSVIMPDVGFTDPPGTVQTPVVASPKRFTLNVTCEQPLPAGVVTFDDGNWGAGGDRVVMLTDEKQKEEFQWKVMPEAVAVENVASGFVTSEKATAGTDDQEPAPLISGSFCALS
jgi:hypothetical protein